MTHLPKHTAHRRIVGYPDYVLVVLEPKGQQGAPVGAGVTDPRAHLTNTQQLAGGFAFFLVVRVLVFFELSLGICASLLHPLLFSLSRPVVDLLPIDTPLPNHLLHGDQLGQSVDGGPRHVQRIR